MLKMMTPSPLQLRRQRHLPEMKRPRKLSPRRRSAASKLGADEERIGDWEKKVRIRRMCDGAKGAVAFAVADAALVFGDPLLQHLLHLHLLQ